MKKWFMRAGLTAVLIAAACSGHGMSEDERLAEREKMVSQDIESRGVRNAAVLEAMRRVKRHEFVGEDVKDKAYEDRPLMIGSGQTISQPYIVAAMTELLESGPDDVVLEVGTGSGYQAAVLAAIVKHVYSIEIIPALGKTAEAKLQTLEVTNVTVRIGDGYAGWPEHAPFDSIMVTCGADVVPEPLLQQLKPGGTMVIPVGPFHAVQELLVVTKSEDGSVNRKSLMPVRFVPMTGERYDLFKGEQ